MLVDKITKKLFGTQDEREVKKMRKIVDKINAIEPQFQNYTDGELSAKTAEFKERLEKGEATAPCPLRCRGARADRRHERTTALARW